MADPLEPRLLLTDPPGFPDIPSTAQQALDSATAYGEGIAERVDSKLQALFQQTQHVVPYQMATRIRESESNFSSFANMTPTGDPPPGTFGTGLKSAFFDITQSFAQEIEFFGANINTNSERKPVTLPSAYTTGPTVSIPGFPGFNYGSTPQFMFGSYGTASVGPGSVTVNVEQTWTNPDLLPGEIDNWSQEVHWSDSVTSNGIIEGEFKREKSSPDGLSAFMWDVKFQRPENLPLTLDVVFSQRDGAWTRSASFKSVGDNVSLEDATLRYENLNTQISFGYHDDALNQKSVVGHAAKTSSLMGQPARAVAGGQWFENGDKSSFGSAGMKFADSWVISGVGVQELDGQTTESLASVMAFLEKDVGGFGGIGFSLSKTGQDGWTGTPPSFLNYYIQKDTPTLLFDVQSLGDNVKGAVWIIVTP